MVYRLLPSVDEVLRQPEINALIAQEGQPAVAEAVRLVLAQLREQVATGNLASEEAVQLDLVNLSEAI